MNVVARDRWVLRPEVPRATLDLRSRQPRRVNRVSSSVCGSSHRVTSAAGLGVRRRQPGSTGLPSRRLGLSLGWREVRVKMLHVSLLGEQTITGGGVGTALARSARAVALVGFLAFHAGSPQPRQRIAGLFWPDSTDAQALTNLRRELHQLRQVLAGEPSLVVTSTDLCWRDTETCRVDLRVFAVERKAALAAAAGGDDDGVLVHAARAIAEYGGDLLPGVYDDWVLEIRSEVERQCVSLCDLLAATRARHGDLPGAVGVA